MTTAGLDERTTDGWLRWLRGAGPVCLERPVLSTDTGDPDPTDPTDQPGPPQLLLRQVFVRAEPDDRRVLDLLVVALVERGPLPGTGPPSSRELAVVGPEAIRAQTAGHAAGLVAGELRIGPVGPGIRSVSLALVRIGRPSRSHDVVSSIEELGRLLDYRRDPEGSAAVARAVVGHLEVLVAGPQVTVTVAGSLTRPWLDAGPDTLYLLTDATAPIGPDEEVELRDGRLTVGRGSRAAGWRGPDYLLLRAGRPVGRRGQLRSIPQLRREHALVEGNLGAETRERAETYSSRAATARQTMRAAQIVGDALTGRTAEAADLLRDALTQPGAEGPLVDQIGGLVPGVPEFWSVLPVVERARADELAGSGTHSVAGGQLLRRLGERLDTMLGLAPSPSEFFDPVMTPIVLEVSNALVPIVDNRQDGGHFLFELIPMIRDRIRDDTGVRVPGVRARGNDSFAPGLYGIQLDEAWVSNGAMLLDGEYVVRSIGTDPIGPGIVFSEVHPLTGAWGRWRIDPVIGGDDPEGERLSRPRYLAHLIELAVRAGLQRSMGRQEIEPLLEQWRAEDAELVNRALPDARAALRLMLVLQDLVGERVPITDWRAILEALEEAGGTATAVPQLRRAVRLRLRDRLPGPRSGPLLIPVPDSIQEALAGPATSVEDPQLEFLRWLRETLAATGPGISVVAHEPEIRELMAGLVRAEHDLVLTFSAAELSAGAG